MPLQPNETKPKPAGEAASAESGNASNPPSQVGAAAPQNAQTLPKEAETYLREAGNIEDLPDANDGDQMEETP